MVENSKGSMVSTKDLVDEEELRKEEAKSGKRVEEDTELTLFALLRKLIAVVEEKENGIVYQLERIATALEGGKGVVTNVVNTSKPTPPKKSSKPPTGSAEAITKTMALFAKGMLDGFDVTEQKYEVRITANEFVGGELYEEIKAIVLEKGGSWMPKKDDRKGYFSISKRNI